MTNEQKSQQVKNFISSGYIRKPVEDVICSSCIMTMCLGQGKPA